MNYNELFESVMCQCVIIIEDDFKLDEYNKERVIYDLTRMDLTDREKYLAEIKDLFPDLAEQLSSYLSLCDRHFEAIGSWEKDVPRGYILPAFSLLSKSDPVIEEALKTKYDTINEAQLREAFCMGLKYGMGVTYPSCFDPLFDEYLLKENRVKSVRVYQNFTASIKESFENDLRHAADEFSIVCIIDNNLDGINRAEEIIDTIINVSGTERKNIIGSIFSSKEKFEKINNSLYFEFTSKASPDQLKACIAKSAYNYFISRLQIETIKTMENAFTCAISNKSIAYYLSQKAIQEGSSEYQIITDWIKLMCSPQKENSKTIKQLITLSRVINSLDGAEDDEILPDSSLEKFNTLEAFDYTINDYLLSVMPGDVFTNTHGDWFVLIGQDCDMVRRGDGKPPKNTVAELLPVKIRPQNEISKLTNDLEKVSINNFRQSLDAPCEIFQVSYRHRQYISNEIINLCSYNEDGSCRLSTTEELNADMCKLLSKQMIDYYGHLQKYYQSIKSLKDKSEDDFNRVIGQAFSPRILSLDEFSNTDGNITFDLRRVCRLTHTYVFYLYKLYLEYRGRQPFESINLVQKSQLTWAVTKEGENTGQYLNFLCTLPPQGVKIHQMEWYVEACEINRVLKSIGIDGEFIEGINLIEIEQVLSLNEKEIVIKKFRKQKVDIRIKQ